MHHLAERPLFRLALTALYAINLLVLCGLARVATDPQVDWHDWIYPAVIGAGMLVGVELLARQGWSRRTNPDSIESSGWLWIITMILLAATCAVWFWTYGNHRDDLAEIERHKSAALPRRYDSGLTQSMQNLQAQHPPAPTTSP